MRVEIVQDRDQWNRFVEAASTGYITQTFEWADLSDNLGSDILRLGALEDGELRGAMIVLVSKMAPLGLPYLYVPRGPVVDDPRSPAMRALVDEARRLARKRGAFMLKIEPNVPDADPEWSAALSELGFRRNPYATHPRRSWVVDVRPTEQQLLANMKMTWRYNVRAAERKGVHIREATSQADIDTWYGLYQETARRDGFFIHPKEHYAKVLHLYRERGAAVQFLAEVEGEAIAGLVVCRCGPVATSMYSASSNRHREKRPNHLLQWTGMRWAKSHGCTLYDFRAIAERLEPAEPDYSLYTYKEGFGGYSVLTLEGHDLPFNAPLYSLYRASLSLKRARVRRRFARRARERQAEAERKATAGKSEVERPSTSKQDDGAAPVPTHGEPTSASGPTRGTRSAE
jgi:lipid II:glycine glycyltransferase (peptidoglycan interpeptide bridge formation enzyme)